MRTSENGLASGFKSLGDRGWIGWYSNIFFDRDVCPDAPRGERFTLAAHKEFTQWANADAARQPELWFWHLPAVRLGRSVRTGVVGPFAVAVGRWYDTALAQKGRAYIEDQEAEGNEWAMSHGFLYPLAKRVNGVYHSYQTREVTVLPRKYASNPVTLFSSKERGIMREVLAELRNALAQIGLKPEEIDKAIDEAAEKQKALSDDTGLGFGQKDADDASPADDSSEGDEKKEDGNEEAVPDTQIEVALADLAMALIAAQEANAQMSNTMSEQTATIKALSKRLEVLEKDAEDRKSLLPRAVIELMQSVRKAGDSDGTVPDSVAAEDIKKREHELDPDNIPNDDPGAWLQAHLARAAGRR